MHVYFEYFRYEVQYKTPKYYYFGTFCVIFRFKLGYIWCINYNVRIVMYTSISSWGTLLVTCSSLYISDMLQRIRLSVVPLYQYNSKSHQLLTCIEMFSARYQKQHSFRHLRLWKEGKRKSAGEEREDLFKGGKADGLLPSCGWTVMLLESELSGTDK